MKLTKDERKVIQKFRELNSHNTYKVDAIIKDTASILLLFRKNEHDYHDLVLSLSVFQWENIKTDVDKTLQIR